MALVGALISAYLAVERLREQIREWGQRALALGIGREYVDTLNQISQELSARLCSLFVRDGEGRRPVLGQSQLFQADPHWRDHVPFHEYFHGDTGAGLGASHQTGWTALVTRCLEKIAIPQAVSRPSEILRAIDQPELEQAK